MIRNILLLEEIKKLDSVIDFDVVVFKGAGFLLKGIYLIDEREMSDVDLFVNSKKYSDLLEILYDLGYKDIPNGRHSFYKIVSQNIPPLIFDVHIDFWGIDFYDLEIEDIGDYENVKVVCDVDLFLTSAIHSVLNHGHFDNKTKMDLEKFLGNKGKDFVNRVVFKANELGFGYIISMVFREIGFYNLNYRYGLKELIALPFLRLAFKKHLVLNEYIISLIFKPSLLLDILKRPLKLKNILLRILDKEG